MGKKVLLESKKACLNNMNTIKKLPIENIRWYKSLDKLFIIIVILISVLGIAAIFSATHYSNTSHANHTYYAKQIVWFLIGIIFMVIFSAIEYQTLVEISYKIYFIVILALIGILLLKHTPLVSQRWFKLGSFSAFQPSEIAKIAIVLALTKYFNDKKGKVGIIGGLTMSLFIVAVPMALIIKQPNLGTALLFVPIILVFLYLIDVKMKYLFYIVGTAAVLSPVGWLFLKGYQKQRLISFLNPGADPLGAGYNIIQSQIAIGSGGLFGKGWLQGTQSYLDFVPEHHTDFIFAVVAEEWGFLGCLVLLMLYVFLIFRGLKIATQARDNYGLLLSLGLTMLITFQVIINVFVALGLLPVTGLPLPFFSYGGSSLIVSMICVGILLNIKICSQKWAP